MRGEAHSFKNGAQGVADRRVPENIRRRISQKPAFISFMERLQTHEKVPFFNLRAIGRRKKRSEKVQKLLARF